jgi:hypothetical protein
MNMRTIAVLNAAAACIFSTSAASQNAKDWIDVKSAEALRAVFANKTFKGKDYLDRPFVEHFREDGNGVRIMGDETRIPRSWTVKGGNQVCVSLPWEVPCYRMQRHKTKAGLYRLVNLGNDQITIVTVEDGIPKF